MVPIPGRTPRESKNIMLRNLATVIEARAMDIIDYVKEELKLSGYADKLTYGLVLTGGSARLKDLDELFRRETNLDVRVATPEAALCEASQPLAADPACATVIGLLLRGKGVSYVQGRDPRTVTTTTTVPPSELKQPAAPVQRPEPPKPPVPPQPPVVPDEEEPDDRDKSDEDFDDPLDDDMPKKEGKGGFWGKVGDVLRKTTDWFESPGDDEI